MLDTGDARKRLAFQTEPAPPDGLVRRARRRALPHRLRGAGCVRRRRLDLAAACALRVCSADPRCRRSTSAWPLTWPRRSGCSACCRKASARELAYTGDRLGRETRARDGFRQRRAARHRRAARACAQARGLDRRQVAARHRREQAGAEPRARSFDGPRPAADDAAAKRRVRHRRDGARHRSLAGEEAGRVRAAGRDRPALRHAGRGHRADAVRRPRQLCCATRAP